MTRPAVEQLRAEGALAGLDLPAAAAAMPLQGHASRRRFVRVDLARDSSQMLVIYPAEEAGDIDRYVRTAAWLRDAGIRVPAILDRGDRALLVEDLGSMRLDRRGLPPGLRGRAYRQAGEIVIQIQRHGMRVPPPNPGWALDGSRLRQEMDFFERHTMAGWLGETGGEDARQRFYDRLVEAVAAQPQAQCHRDYHSRNLMIAHERVALVDFQDQMAGPCFYDLASLLLDDYRDVETQVRSDLLHQYWITLRPRVSPVDGARLPKAPAGLPAVARQAFCVVALQRSLKALGTFGYQVTVARNEDFARFAPRTWSHARRALALLGWSDVRELTVPLEGAFG